MALTQAKWRAKLELIAPTWFFETEEEQDAHLNASAKLLEQLDLDVDAHIANTFILQANDLNIDAQGDERSIIRLFGELDAVYAPRVQSLKNLSNCPALKVLVDNLLIDPPPSIAEGLLLLSTFKDSLFIADHAIGSNIHALGGVTEPTIVTKAGLKRVFIPFDDGATLNFNNVGNSSGNRGSLSYSFITNYVGAPTGNARRIVNIALGGSHEIVLTHKLDGDLDLSITTAAGTSVFTLTVPFVAGRPNKVDISWRVDALPDGLIYLLINGVLQNSGAPFTFPTSTRINDGVTDFGQGGLPGGADFFIGDIESYSNLNHIADYTPRFDYLGATFHVNFNNGTTDADFAYGSKAIVAGESESNIDGFIDLGIKLIGSEFVDYPGGSGNADSNTQIAARLMWNPEFLSFPGATESDGLSAIMSFKEATGLANAIQLFVGGANHATYPKKIALQLYDNAGAIKVDEDLGVFDRALFAPWIEAELNINFVTGNFWFLLNGSLIKTASFTPFTRAPSGTFRFGLNSPVNNTTNIDDQNFDSLTIFNETKHTAAYTPGIVESDFSEDLGLLSVLRESVAIFQEDDVGAIFMDRDAHMNRGFLLLLPVLYSFSIIVDKQIHAPYSFIDRAIHLNRSEFMGTIESNIGVFQSIQEIVEINKAYGTLFRIVERVA